MTWLDSRLRVLRVLLGVVLTGPAQPADGRARVALFRDRARSAGGLTLTCGGRSMEPVLGMGETVRVRDGEIRRGAVAAFVGQRGSLELHRLVLAMPGVDWWIHAGDNQVASELGLVHAAQIVGIAELPVVAPGVTMSVRAAARLARAALRLTARAQPR